MKYVLALLALLFCGAAQAQDALVVQSCGTLGQAYSVGATRQLTVDVNGNLCAAGTGFALQAKSGTAASVTGTASETILATIVIPPNTIGANGQIRIRTYWTLTNSVNNKTLRVRLGTTGIASTQVSSLIATTIASAMGMVDIQDANATNSQNIFTEIARGTDGLVTTVMSTSAIDMTVAENIYITGQLANTGETITLTGYSVESVF